MKKMKLKMKLKRKLKKRVTKKTFNYQIQKIMKELATDIEYALVFRKKLRS